jgi:hypothetical protein
MAVKALDLTARLDSARSVRYIRDLMRVLKSHAVRDFAAEVTQRPGRPVARRMVVAEGRL